MLESGAEVSAEYAVPKFKRMKCGPALPIEKKRRRARNDYARISPR